MSIPAATKNLALDGITINQVGLHDDYPGATGANELTGGSYARQTATFNAASGGQRLLSASVAFSGLPSCTVRWVSFWQSGTFRGAVPNGGATPRNFVSLASNDTFYSPSHGYSDNQKVVFWQGTVPGGLTAGAVYFVRDASTDTFKIAATAGGTAINLTSAPSFGCIVCAITEAEYLIAGGTHTLASATLAVPD
jgi:hypothetical protein